VRGVNLNRKKLSDRGNFATSKQDVKWCADANTNNRGDLLVSGKGGSLTEGKELNSGKHRGSRKAAPAQKKAATISRVHLMRDQEENRGGDGKKKDRETNPREA